jgi:hypothetical protein
MLLGKYNTQAQNHLRLGGYQPGRRQYEGLDLVPHAPKVLAGNLLNLWRGWGVQPKEGDWTRLQHHLWVVLANEERRSYDYIRNWIAWKYQNPAGRPEVALNIKGKKGTGKGANNVSHVAGVRTTWIGNP